jgi:hypothetical protein
MNPPWNTLEVAKLAASTLTPISVAILGLFLGRAAKRFEARQWASQKVVEKRLLIYDAMAPLLNDLYCYIRFVGNWKDHTPSDVILKKRQLDRHAHVYAPLFSAEFFTAYQQFLDTCFATWTGEGHDARILADPTKHKAAAEKVGKPWDPGWDTKFDVAKSKTSKDVIEAYTALMRRFSSELGVGLSGPGQ